MHETVQTAAVLRESGGGGMVCFGLQLPAPIGRSPLTTFRFEAYPPQAVVPTSLSPPCALPLPPGPIFPVFGKT